MPRPSWQAVLSWKPPETGDRPYVGSHPGGFVYWNHRLTFSDGMVGCKGAPGPVELCSRHTSNPHPRAPRRLGCHSLILEWHTL